MVPAAEVPNPESATVCGLLLAESAIVKAAVRVPVDNGLKRTATLQVALAARLDPQVLLEMMKSAALAPVIAMPLMEIETEPPLVSVTVFAAPTLPTATLAQLRLEGLTVAAAWHFDPEIRKGIRSAPNIATLKVLSFFTESLAEREAGTRDDGIIRRSMGISFSGA